MISDMLVIGNGMAALEEKLGVVDAGRFISIVNANKFDYTKWRQDKFEDMSVEEYSKKAMEYQKSLKK